MGNSQPHRKSWRAPAARYCRGSAGQAGRAKYPGQRSGRGRHGRPRGRAAGQLCETLRESGSVGRLRRGSRDGKTLRLPGEDSERCQRGGPGGNGPWQRQGLQKYGVCHPGHRRGRRHRGGWQAAGRRSRRRRRDRTHEGSGRFRPGLRLRQNRLPGTVCLCHRHCQKRQGIAGRPGGEDGPAAV